MKTSSGLFRAADIASLGALIAFTGCTSDPVRQSTHTLEFQDTQTSAITEMGGSRLERPTPLHRETPFYPIAMRNARVSGSVRLNCVIDDAGRVTDVQVQSSTHAEFEEPAREALMKWTFKPATRDGVAVATRASIPINFNCD